MSLKAGHLEDFAGSLAEAIETALAAEWQSVKGQPLPGVGRDDRRMLFVAIAQGVLSYLKAHENEMVKRISLDVGTGAISNAVTGLELDVAG